MLRQCFELNLGIMFHKNAFEHVGLNPDHLYPVVKPRPEPLYYEPGCLAHQFNPPINSAKDYRKTIHAELPFESEELEDMMDSLAPIYDQLKMAKFWWFIEMFPTTIHHQLQDNTWSKKIGSVMDVEIC